MAAQAQDMTEEAPSASRPAALRKDPPGPDADAAPGGRGVLPRLTDRFRRLGADDRHVLWLYLATRLGVWLTAYCARWLFPARPDARDPGPLLTPFEHWDWHHYLDIARDGYFPADAGPSGVGDNREAFFPGFPLVLRAVHLLIPHWTLAGLTVSLAAGAVAVLALARIARLHLSDSGAGQRAVLFLLTSPCAVFLAVGYTEALFLALALPAWLLAQRRNWPGAALLAAAATTVRVSGLFLTAALVLLFLLTVRGHRDWRRLPWLALPALPPAVHSAFLHAHTGDWMAWKHAEERGWHRTFHTPWDAWAETWHNAFEQAQTTNYAFMFQVELVAMLLGLALLALLIRRRRWPEALYIALTLYALGTSFWYVSIPRATLLWWPLWIALAAFSLRRPRFTTVYLSLAAPLTTVYALAFLTGRWAG